MEEELRLSLLLLGGFFILGVLAHGLWNIRKNNQAKKPQRRIEPEGWQDDERDDIDDRQDDTNEFDEYGIGEVRVVHKSVPEQNDAGVTTAVEDDNQSDQATDDDSDDGETAGTLSDDVSAQKPPASPAAQQPKEKLYASVVTNPKPQYQNDNVVELPDSVPAPPAFLLKEEPKIPPAQPAAPQDDFSLDTQPAPPEPAAPASLAKDAGAEPIPLKKRSRGPVRRRQEPRFGDDEQMQIDFDDSVKAESGIGSASAGAGQVEPEVLILNVRAPEDAPISGAALLPMLLTLGFKFGDQDIFHRHVNSNGKGPVLFSLANMFKPGNFDIDNLETFTTRGVSLFMLLPIEGDPHQVFNMMHNAARKIADEFNAQVLDGRRSVLSKQGLQQYVEKIRDFERKRMIARH